MDMNKLIARLPAGFAADCESFDAEGLKRVVIESEQALSALKRDLAQHEQLQAARQVVKDLMGPFNEAKRAQQAKIDYALMLLEDRGRFIAPGEAVGVEISVPGQPPVKTTLAALEKAASSHSGAVERS